VCAFAPTSRANFSIIHSTDHIHSKGLPAGIAMIQLTLPQKRFIRELYSMLPPGTYRQHEFYNRIFQQLGDNLTPSDPELSAAARRALDYPAQQK
jgi:hypothetical protein